MKHQVLIFMNQIPCALGGKLRVTEGLGLNAKIVCNVCDTDDYEHSSGTDWKCSEVGELCNMLVSIIPRLSRSPKLRITAMTALRRNLVHVPYSSHLQLTSSVFGEFCLHSLRSSVRELRIATGYVCLFYLD